MIKPIKDICAIIDGHLTVFKHLFKKAVTLEYPEKKRKLNDKFRGKLEIKLDDNGCVGCGICKKVCPTGAISFQKDDNNNVVEYIFDLKKCIFCGNCKFYCPHSVISMTQEYELGSNSKECLELRYKKEK